MTNKSNKKEFSPMKTCTRRWFLATFGNGTDGIDYNAAAKFCDVSPRTVRYWWSTSCPPWIDRLAYLASRSIPESKEWQGFGFSHDGKLLTPYKNLTFTSGQLLNVFFDRQFNRFDRAEKEKLSAQVDSLRSDEEAAAIRDELEVIINTLTKLKQSPIVAPKKAFAKTAKRTVKRSE
ncbi:hypothetical protein AYI95_01760 [Shewanella xiamenensis]|uniref:phage protein n=2 Tax=Shewanella TaxID=22 RepID=UPI001D2BFDBB|nr:phage protein [Shewanella sp. MM_2022_3]MCH7422647.1 phage protein [Shewanella sp. MM_2022_3]TVL36254.1 hypothetical protein AYI95_01760 [Shewanella xiamenensis]